LSEWPMGAYAVLGSFAWGSVEHPSVSVYSWYEYPAYLTLWHNPRHGLALAFQSNEGWLAQALVGDSLQEQYYQATRHFTLRHYHWRWTVGLGFQYSSRVLQHWNIATSCYQWATLGVSNSGFSPGCFASKPGLWPWNTTSGRG
jgi:hypothetical protein